MRNRSPTRLCEPGWFRSALLRTLPAWVGARVLIAAGFAVAYLVSVSQRPLTLDQGLLSWDASWYRWIADLGYGDAPDGAIRFFPLLPLFGRWLGLLTAGRTDISLVIITSLVALLATIALHELIRFELTDSAARLSVWIFSLFPTAFVLVAPYTEGLLVLFGSCYALALRQRRPELAIVFGLLAGLSRPLGALLVVFALAELFGRRDRASSPQASPPEIVAAVAPAIGVALFAAWAQLAGHGFFAPFDAQRELRGSFRDPLSRFIEAIWNGAGGDMTELLHALATVGFGLLVLLLWRRDLRPYAIYAGVGLLVAISSSNLNSLIRYGHGMFPFTIGLVIVLGDRRIARRVALVAAAISVVAFTAAILNQRYVP